MARINFCSGSYSSQALTADCQRTVNWYPETVESGYGKSTMALYPGPGLKLFAQLVGPFVRGSIFVQPPSAPNGRLFVIVGANFYEVDKNGAIVLQRAIADDGNRAFLAASVNQILIASAGIAYVFDLAAGTLAPVIALNGITISQVAYDDGFFLALNANSQKIQASAALDATTWPGAAASVVSVYPDVALGMIVDHRELVLFGAKQTVSYYDSGNFPFAFDVVPGGFAEDGIGAPATATRMDNTVYWWEQDERGFGIARKLQSYSPVRISNHAIEHEIQGYPTIADAVSFSYQMDGHTFWRTYFPSAFGGRGATWEYDVATQLWNEPRFWNPNTGLEEAHRGRDHVFAFGKHLVGDRASGNLYEMKLATVNGTAWDFADDFGNPIRRLRRTPVVSTEDEWMTFEKMVFAAEMGLGPQPALQNPDGTARGPQGILQWSDDDAKTFSQGVTVDFGQAGQYDNRVTINRLGATRKGRIFQFTYSDPAPLRLADVYLYGTGLPPQERLIKQLGQRA